MRCAACSHPDRDGIDAGLAAGTPAREVARRFGVGRNVLARHREHLAEHELGDVAGPPPPGLLDPDHGARVLASFAASLDALERAEEAGRLPLVVSAIRGTRAASRQLVGLHLGEVSDGDRVEDLYRRVVAVYGRCVGRGGLELAALSALRGVLADVRAAAGEVQGEAEIKINHADGTPAGPSGFVPASSVAGWPAGRVIELSFPQTSAADIDPRLLPPEEPNGNGRSAP